MAELLHGKENAAYADAGYTGGEKREEHLGREVIWQIAAQCSTYSTFPKYSLIYKSKRRIERTKAQIRKVKHPFRVSERQLGYAKPGFVG